MSRMQLALNVENLEQSVAFYRRLFDAEPAKVKPGYANFAITEPALKHRADRESRTGRLHQSPGRRGTRHRHRRRDPAPPRRARPRLRRRARHHLLLRQAEQVLGPGHTER